MLWFNCMESILFKSYKRLKKYSDAGPWPEVQATNWVPLFYHIGDLESGFPSLQRGFSEVNCWGLKLWICSLWTFLFQGPASIKSSWRWQKYQSDLNWIQSLKYKVSNTKSQIQSLKFRLWIPSLNTNQLRRYHSETLFLKTVPPSLLASSFPAQFPWSTSPFQLGLRLPEQTDIS